MESLPVEGTSTNLGSVDALLGNSTPEPINYEQMASGTTYDLDNLPEEYKGENPTCKILPPKVIKRTLPPENKTTKLPPKEVTNKKKPLFPPGVEPFDIPNF